MDNATIDDYMTAIDIDLHAIDVYLEYYVDLTEAQFFFEAEQNDDIKKAKNHNAVIEDKSMGRLSRIIETLSNIVHSIIDKITTFINKFRNGKQLQEVENELNKHSELKNKTVNAVDVNAMMEAYDEAFESLNRAEKSGNYEQQQQTIVSTLKKKLWSLAKPITTEVAINMARMSPEIARKINVSLAAEDNVLGEIRNQLGNKEYKRFRKDLQALSRKASFRKFRINLFRKEVTDLNDAVNTTISSITDLIPNFHKDGKDTSNRTLKNRVKDKANTFANSTRMGAKIMRDKENRDTVKKAAKIGFDIKRYPKKQEKAMKGFIKKTNKEVKQWEKDNYL